MTITIYKTNGNILGVSEVKKISLYNNKLTLVMVDGTITTIPLNIVLNFEIN